MRFVVCFVVHACLHPQPFLDQGSNRGHGAGLARFPSHHGDKGASDRVLMDFETMAGHGGPRVPGWSVVWAMAAAALPKGVDGASGAKRKWCGRGAQWGGPNSTTVWRHSSPWATGRGVTIPHRGHGQRTKPRKGRGPDPSHLRKRGMVAMV